jgi:FkbH-like protein
MSCVSVDVADQALAVERLLGMATHQSEARLRLAELLDRDPSTSAYLKWSRRVPNFAESRRVALISSYTVETIDPFLAVEAYLSGWRSSPSFIQYSNWQPALLDPSKSLDGHDAAVLLLDEASLADKRPIDSTATAESITDFLSAFRAKSKLPLFVGLTPARPSHHAIGLGHDERMQALSQLQWVNAAIATFCARDRATHLIDVPGALAACGDAWHDSDAFAATMSYINNRGYPALARAIARSIGGLLVSRHKVLVTDLDGTLWGGILGEDGVEGISVGKDRQGRAHAKYQGFLKQLRASGIILAIASKNDESHVREAFEVRAKELAISWEDFTIARVNWKPKSENLREIADELGLGLDSFVFVDDSPIECEEVRHSLPMVTVIPVSPSVADLPGRILASRAFDTLAISREDHARAEQYHAERARKTAAARGSDLENFLASLELKVALSASDDDSADRILQLLLKTNQFHLTLERPSPAILANRLKDGCELYAVRLADRFGDYGIIGAVELEAAPPSMLIRNLAVSCRALGRKVEDAIAAFAADRAREKQCERLVANYVAGPRNRVIEEALQRLGFSVHSTDGAGRAYALPVTASSPAWPKHVEIVIEAGAP